MYDMIVWGINMYACMYLKIWKLSFVDIILIIFRLSLPFSHTHNQKNITLKKFNKYYTMEGFFIICSEQGTDT